MPSHFRVGSSTHFEREFKKILRFKPQIAPLLPMAEAILEIDPYNISRQHRIKKLADVKEGDGCWRLRLGDYRLRYDIVGREVVLKHIRHRKDAYR